MGIILVVCTDVLHITEVVMPMVVVILELLQYQEMVITIAAEWNIKRERIDQVHHLELLHQKQWKTELHLQIQE